MRKIKISSLTMMKNHRPLAGWLSDGDKIVLRHIKRYLPQKGHRFLYKDLYPLWRSKNYDSSIMTVSFIQKRAKLKKNFGREIQFENAALLSKLFSSVEVF